MLFSCRFINFGLRLGSTSNRRTCDYSDSNAESLVMQYSNDGGITWVYVRVFTYTSYRHASGTVAFQLPAGSRTNSTRFRLWQGSNSGATADQWAIDDFVIGGTNNNPQYLIGMSGLENLFSNTCQGGSKQKF